MLAQGNNAMMAILKIRMAAAQIVRLRPVISATSQIKLFDTRIVGMVRLMQGRSVMMAIWTILMVVTQHAVLRRVIPVRQCHLFWVTIIQHTVVIFLRSI